MEYKIIADGRVSLLASADEVLTLRHGLIEALEALSEQELLIRTGGAKTQAEELLATLKRVSIDLSAGNEP